MKSFELVRRVGNMATILAMLIGLPFTAFLVGSNAVWALVVGLAVARLLKRGAMAPRLRGFAGELVEFFREHTKSIMRSGTFALSDIFIYTFPYYVVPWAFGLARRQSFSKRLFAFSRRKRHLYRGLRPCHSGTNPRAGGARCVPAGAHTLVAAALCCLPLRSSACC